MPIILGLTVNGKIYHDKFSSLTDWTEEEDLRNEAGQEPPWENLSFTELATKPAFSSMFALQASVQTDAGESNNLPSGRYIRRKRTVTIPSGVTSVRMQVRHRWKAGLATMALARKIVLGTQTFLNQQAIDAQDTWHFADATVSTSAGSKDLYVGVESYALISPTPNNVQNHCFDDLVIARSTTLKVTSMTTGWLAKLFDTSDSLVAEAQESGGTATLDISAKAYPIVGRLKLYNALGILQWTGDEQEFFGGDEYRVFSMFTSLSGSLDNYIIRKTGGAAPTSAVATFTLKDGDGAPIATKPITFSTSHGSVNPTSGNTNANGQVSTTLTAASLGFAVIKASFAGDTSYPKTYATLEVNVHDTVESPSADREYEVWVQGKLLDEVTVCSLPQTAEDNSATVHTGDEAAAIAGFYDFTIYRKGVKMFAGRVEAITKSIAPDLMISFHGRNMVLHLMRCNIAQASYEAQGIKTAIEAIHTSYIAPHKQVLLGTVAPALDLYKVTFKATDINAFDLIQTLARLGGALLLVDASRTLHVR